MYRKHNERRTSSSFGLTGLFFAVVGIAIFVFLGNRFLPALLSKKVGRFDRFTVIVNGPKVKLVSVSFVDNAAVVVNLPGDLYVAPIAHGYGQYRISKIYSVGELDHRGGLVLKDSVSDFIGVPVDGFVQSSRAFSDLKPFFASWDFILSDKTDMDFWDRLRFVQTIMSMRFDKIKKADLAQVAQPITLNDGSTALSVNSEELDRDLKSLFSETSILDEKLRVSVVNSTDTAGLGNLAGRIMGNMGIIVVSVDSSNQSVSQCVVKTSESNLKSRTVLRIADVFGCQTKRSESDGRSDAQVIIGSDYASHLDK